MASAGGSASDEGEATGDGERMAAAEEDQLQTSLGMLSRLATGQLALEDTLTQVARLAVRAIPGAGGGGLTLLEHGRSDTVVTTAPFVSEVDAIQYGLGQGPCITATAERQTVLSMSLGADRRWPQFGSKVARLGVHSALSLPLITPEGVVGAMNIYARGKGAFDTRAAELGQMFAVPAAIAVQNAQVLAEAKRLADVAQGIVDEAVRRAEARHGG